MGVCLCLRSQQYCQNIVQAFLTKLVTDDTEHCREKEFAWLYGPTLACPESFRPLLRHYMMQVSHLEKYTALESHVETARARMEKNINLLLEREAKLEDLQEDATRLQEWLLCSRRRPRTSNASRCGTMQNMALLWARQSRLVLPLSRYPL